MRSRMTKLAAAAVIIIAVLIGINQFGGSIDGAGVAFAEVLEHIRTSNYTFDLTVLTEDQASNTGQAMVLEPGRVRLNWAVGLGKVSSIIDISEGKSLLLFHQFKTGQIREVPTPGKDDGAGGIFALCTKPIENLWDLRNGTEEELGEKEIDGQILKELFLRLYDLMHPKHQQLILSFLSDLLYLHDSPRKNRHNSMTGFLSHGQVHLNIEVLKE